MYAMRAFMEHYRSEIKCVLCGWDWLEFFSGLQSRCHTPLRP